MKMPSKIAIIPARYDSSRLPGKPLRKIAGKPLIERVVEQLEGVQMLDHIYIATDDERIAEFCRTLGEVGLMMTSGKHRSGTERCAEAAEDFADETIVLNVQGDEPFISRRALSDLISFYQKNTCAVGTLAASLDAAAADDPHTVKTVMDRNQKALYFSRASIPYSGRDSEVEYFKHLGVYIFRNNILQKVSGLSPTPLEGAEGLEQLRWMEHGYSIGIQKSEGHSFGIDTEADLDKAEQILGRTEDH